MSFGLPEPPAHVGAVALACLDVDLVEESEDAYCFDVSLLLPEGLDRRVEVLPNSLWAGVPETDFFDQLVGE